jgi:hypothetical protein
MSQISIRDLLRAAACRAAADIPADADAEHVSEFVGLRFGRITIEFVPCGDDSPRSVALLPAALCDAVERVRSVEHRDSAPLLSSGDERDGLGIMSHPGERDVDAALLRVATVEPQLAKVLVRKSGYKHNSYTASALTRLVRGGKLIRTADGLRLPVSVADSSGAAKTCPICGKTPHLAGVNGSNA